MTIFNIPNWFDPLVGTHFHPAFLKETLPQNTSLRSAKHEEVSTTKWNYYGLPLVFKTINYHAQRAWSRLEILSS